MTIYTTEHRNAAVLKVLQEADGPMTPTKIAKKINEPWCCPWGPCSAPISPVLKRIGAVRVVHSAGKWIKPQE
jgi:hypothetical protein